MFYLTTFHLVLHDWCHKGTSYVISVFILMVVYYFQGGSAIDNDGGLLLGVRTLETDRATVGLPLDLVAVFPGTGSCVLLVSQTGPWFVSLPLKMVVYHHVWVKHRTCTQPLIQHFTKS